MITWRDDDWIEVGARVRLTHRPPGEKISAHPVGGRWSDDMPALVGGARGVVVKAPSGGSPAHRCPNHGLGLDDCYCGDDAGMFPERLPTAVVVWELDDGGELRQLLRYPGDGGRAWELVEPDAWTAGVP